MPANVHGLRLNTMLGGFEIFMKTQLAMKSKLLLAGALLVGFLVSSTLAATPQEEAKVLIDQLNTAQAAKDEDGVGRLLSDDCVVIMTEPNTGAKATRFFTKKEYLDALRSRDASVSATFFSSTNQVITTSPSGDVFVARDAESRSRIGATADWIRSREAFILKRVDGQLKIHTVVAEAAFYYPEVPPEPPK